MLTQKCDSEMWLNISIWPIYGTTTPDQSGPESNGSKGVLHNP